MSRTKPYVAVLIVFGAIFALCYWLTGAIDSTRRSANATNCLGHFCSISIAMHEYHAKYGHFPPAIVADATGRPMHSWRVLLLEFRDPGLFRAYNFSEPWNGPNNSKLADRMPSFYRCANAPSGDKTHTSYVVLVGPNTLFPGARHTKLQDVKTDRSKTIMLVEADNLNIHWMEPRDWDMETMEFAIADPIRPTLSRGDPRGPGVSFADASYDRLPLTTSKAEFIAMSRILP